MTAAQLLNPRFKLIASYPNCTLKIDTVIEYSLILDGDIETWVKEKEQYPHIFKKLTWWEERAVEQMQLRNQLEQGSIDRAIELLTPLCGVINDQYAVDEICQLFDPEINMLLDEPLFVQCLINFFNNKKNNETKSIEIALRICKLIDNQ